MLGNVFTIVNVHDSRVSRLSNIFELRLVVEYFFLNRPSLLAGKVRQLQFGLDAIEIANVLYFKSTHVRRAFVSVTSYVIWLQFLVERDRMPLGFRRDVYFSGYPIWYRNCMFCTIDLCFKGVSGVFFS